MYLSDYEGRPLARYQENADGTVTLSAFGLVATADQVQDALSDLMEQIDKRIVTGTEVCHDS